jgi:acyl-CoA thioesterase YciA
VFYGGRAQPIVQGEEDVTEPLSSTPPSGPPAIRTVAMPSDTNPAGDMFGGWMMWQMDLAAGLAATRRARGRCATVAVEAMTFHNPVHVGDEVSLYAEIVHVGRTSMRIAIEAWRRPRHSEVSERVTEAVFTFVAIDDLKRPRPVDAS